MRKCILIKFLFLTIGIISFKTYAQNLTISASGETGTSGSNWSITGNVLNIANSGSASINSSVISNHLSNTGDLTINLPWQSGVGRNININNTIAFSGSSARTLTFQSANDIVFANAAGITSSTASLNVVLRSATTLGSPDNGSVKMDGVNIDTKGGHLWVGGGSSTTTWNGLSVGGTFARTYLDDVAGISIVGSTIASGGGNIYVHALSWDMSDNDGMNYGINFENSVMSSGNGTIYLSGLVYGRYNNGIGMRINGATATSITTTSGALTIYGYGTDATTNGNYWRNATMINGSVSIKSGSGNIAVTGEAAFASPVNDKEGLIIGNGSAICSQTGNITLNGTNTLESSGQYSNSIRFAAADVANSIRIGYDGTNAYSGNITIEGNSIYQRSTQAGAGSIAVQTTGTLTIQPTGTAFTYMRAGNDGAGAILTFDNDWNFGTTLGGFVYGKTTNTSALTFSNTLATTGPITIYAGNITHNTAFSTTSASGHISLLSKSHIVNSSATTITTQGGNVLFASNVDNATDGESTTNGYIQLRSGITINSNGGNITFGGGNTSGTDYALGSSNEAYTEGIRFDAVIALNSGGGNISLRGKSYAMGVQTIWGASGVGFYFFSAATGTINSGIGTITIDGYSQTNTSSYAAGFYCMHNLTITSANTTANAIRLIGKATGTSGEAWGIETESIFSVLATGIGGGISLSSSQQNSGNNYDIVFRGETNLLAVSGPINIITGQLGGITNGYLFLAAPLYLGSKAGAVVTNSSSNINIQVDRFNYNNYALPKLATSGSVTIQPNATSFGMDIYTSYFSFNENGKTMTNFIYGKSGNAGNLYINSALTVAGPISVYGNYVQINDNITITSSATGDIFIKSLYANNPSVYIGAATINKSAGTGTLTFQANGRVQNYGTIGATGTGLLNVVMWSDYDNTNNDGGISHFGTLSTNGGHVWLGGSNTTSGSYSWKGLSVGDGPSIGSTNYNCNAIDLWGSITTGGGDVLLWASNNGGCGNNGIGSDGTRLINSGLGNITLIAPQTSGAIELTSTGVVSLVPHAGSYTSALTLGGTLTSGNFTFNTSFYNGLKINSLANTGLVIGNYTGHLSGGNPVTQGNTSNVTASTALATKSLEIYGGAVVASAALTAAGNIILDGDNGSFLTQNTKGVEINAAVTTSNNGNVTIHGRGGSTTGINTHGINVTNLVEAGGTGTLSLIGYGGLSANGASSSCHGVNIDGANAWVKSNGGNVSINGSGGGAGSGTYSQGVCMLSSKISAGGSGTITVTGTGGVNTAVGLRGILLITGSSIFSAGGAISISGINGTNGSNNSDGVTIDASTVGSNASGAITISGQAGGGVGSDAISLSNTNTIGATSHPNNIVLRGNNFSISGTSSVLTNGKVTIEPNSNSFTSEITFPITSLSIANTITGLTIGKPTNSANITFTNATTINGPITIYGGTLALNENLSSSAGSTISLYGNILNFASGKTVTSSGLLIVAPQNTAGSIGMCGATGTLQLPASYFSTNFTDGFSLIQIGSNNHSSAIVSNAFNLRDHMALYTTGSVTLGGKPVLGVNNLTLGSAISSISSGATNYFQTNGTGKVFRNIPNGSNLILPIGRAFYNPVTIKNNTGTADDFSALVLDSVFLNGTTGPLITTPHVKATWDISKANANSGSGIDFEFGWDLTQETGTFTSYQLNHFASTWSFAAGTSQTPSGSTMKVMSHTGYTGTFSPFAISEGDYALPVELISFNASCISNETKLEWQTASEHNTSHFVVERSLDGMVWEKLGEVTAAGNSTSILNYSFIDTALVARALTYYRLVQIDIDGKSETFGPVSSDCATNNEFEVVIIPNPNDGLFTLKIDSENSQEIDIRIYQMDGKEVALKSISNTEGTSIHYIDLGGFTSGIYALHIYHNKGVLIKKAVIK
jgi:hypothetical protein